MILDIRGTHGSGKSHIVHTILQTHKHQAILVDGEHLGYYVPEWDACILGRYNNICGGCDGIKTANEVVRRVIAFSRVATNVILEGILVAHTFGRYSKLATYIERRTHHQYCFAFLDTPLETCIARVQKRRAERGNTKPFDPRNVISDHARIWERLRLQAKEAGHYCVEIKHKRKPVSQALLCLDKCRKGSLNLTKLREVYGA